MIELDDLFQFPVMAVDAYKEYQREKNSENLGFEESSQPETIRTTAEHPYYEFLSIEDRWLASEDSIDRAKQGIFDACIVKFTTSDFLLVPWSREKFKRELRAFSEKREKESPMDVQTTILEAIKKHSDG